MKNYQQKYENGENESLVQEIKNIVESRIERVNKKLERIIEQQQEDRTFIKKQLDRLMDAIERSKQHPQKRELKEQTIKIQNYVNNDGYLQTSTKDRREQKDRFNLSENYELNRNNDTNRLKINYNERRLSFDRNNMQEEVKEQRKEVNEPRKEVKESRKEEKVKFNQSYNIQQMKKREVDKGYMNHSTNNFYNNNKYELDIELKQDYKDDFVKKKSRTNNFYNSGREKEEGVSRRSHNTSQEKNSSLRKGREGHSNVKKKVMFADQSKDSSNDYIQQKRQQIEDQIEQRLKDSKHFHRKTIQQEQMQQSPHFGKDIEYQKQLIYQKLK